MDITSAKWLSELGMEDHTFINQCQMNSLDDQSFDEFNSFSSNSYTSYLNFDTKGTPPNISSSSIKTSLIDGEKPPKQLKMDRWNSCTAVHMTPKAASSSSSQLISFENNSPGIGSQKLYGNLDCTMKPKDKTVTQGNMNLPSLISQGSYENQNYHSPNSGQGTQRTTFTRTPLHAQDHVLAERKRREKLTQRFVALSALLPGLKKMDKASVLGDAIKHLQHLEEHVKKLEEQTAKKTMESVVFVKRTRLSAEDDTSSSDENFVSCSNQPLPEIEARVSEKDVLIRIHCEKHKGFIVKILSEIEKLDLTVTNSSVLPFGNYAMDITVVAQMDVEFCMTVKDLVRNLRQAFLKFM
ncbi:hypothetical protein L1049_023974 [Liquidambar formosana]|uniref:BHLH domain-containing protein n=1 Tax=Liquidambar formosana TaxID=63359 RepID=A0AAP0WZ58_LIQFO